jgi:hypothetical protein
MKYNLSKSSNKRAVKGNVGVSSSDRKIEILQLIEEVRGYIPWKEILFDSNKYLVGIDGNDILGFKIGEKILLNKFWDKSLEFKAIRYSKELFVLDDGSLRVFNCKYKYINTNPFDFENNEEISKCWNRRLSRSQNLDEFDIELIKNLCKRVQRLATAEFIPIKKGISTEWVAVN